ncbi:probable insulin-like peptide 3 [Stomoxys calcitrans]|uniref:probable insulin-like peptide 3 n=1 Tax=Stomoxys calcitrans TaxID=35570 RepID=UPI0027E346DF|nr:probable insulin-like peptide 3 [Stomoxys calcitrans]
MKLLSVFILFVALYEIHASRLCGDTLVQVLRMVCINGFPTMTKKSSNNLVLHDMDILDKFKSNTLLNDFMYGNPINLLAKTRKQRHLLGVVDECCRNECTLEELAEYCL